MNKKALIIIAKYPDKDNVKTRLSGFISDGKRIALYKALLENTILKLRSIHGVDSFIAYAPESSGEYFSRFNTGLIALQTGDLGEGMLTAFEAVLGRGYKSAVLVGVDIPGLSSGIINSAFNILEKKDLVFGPAKDGGYYLLGMKKIIKEVFHNVPWSSDATLRESLRQAEKYGYSAGFTGTLSDIDTIEDIENSDLKHIIPDPPG